MAKFNVTLTNLFKKDLKLAKKRGLDLEDLFHVVELLANESPIPDKYRDHSLHGDYVGYRECHILPDWLLIYKKEIDIKILALYRTGTHSDLFSKKKK